MSNEKKIETGLPRAEIKETRRISPVWFVPLLAAIAAGWLVFDNVRASGPVIHVLFTNANGLLANQTPVKYRGMRVGYVRSIQLTADTQQVDIEARLNRSGKKLAKAGAAFWIVRPEVGSTGLRGLDTIVSGAYIEMRPGTGRDQKNFTGASRPPTIKDSEGRREIILTTPQISTLSIGAPVYYRGMEVGSVSYFVLNDKATGVNIHVLIETNFAPLVRNDSKFWNAGGISMRLKLFGIDVSAENFKSLLIGGLAFATPENYGPVATNLSVFELNEKPDDKWLKWSAAIGITNSQIKAPEGSASSILLNSMEPEEK